MHKETDFDVIIVGGGLAGLAASICLQRQGYHVALLEKRSYPFHRVCGEYISMESWPFVESLGIPLAEMNLPRIDQLVVTGPLGARLQVRLPLGGFGLSRYTLDDLLAKQAKSIGVTVLEEHRVNDIQFRNDIHEVSTPQTTFRSKLVLAAFGKRSRLDVHWKRPFVLNRQTRLNNWVGVKYHVSGDFPADRIELHNFKDGYCGFSKIDADRYCLCYLTRASNLREYGPAPADLEKALFDHHPGLAPIRQHATVLWKEPETISQVSFSPKSQVEDHCLMIGDAAGMITPLCGNGMSMALHGAQLAADAADQFLRGNLSRTACEKQYTHAWKKQFGKRLWVGRQIQRLFGQQLVTELFIRLLKPFPGLVRWLIRQTHGDQF